MIKKKKKSLISIFLSGIANILSFKGYQNRRKNNYFIKFKK